MRSLRSGCARRSASAAMLGVLTAPALAQTYTIVDLGTLGESSGAAAINQAGHAAGWSNSAPGFYHAVFHDGDDLHALPMPGTSNWAIAEGINDLDHVVGIVEVPAGFGEDDQAHLWRAGQPINLGTLGGTFSYAYGINNHDHVVGRSKTANGEYPAFIWKDGQMSALPDLGYPDAEARSITDGGVIAGFSWDANLVRQAVLWRDMEVWRVLEMPADGLGAMAYMADDEGNAVGTYWKTGNRRSAVRWDADGHAVPLPPIRTFYYNEARGFNSAGQIVGSSYTGGHGAGSTVAAVLWESDRAFDLYDLVDHPAGWAITNAYDINDAGQIVGTGSFGGGYRAFRLDPIPGGLGITIPSPGLSNAVNTVNMRGATPGATVHVIYSLRTGSANLPGCPGVRLGLRAPSIFGSAVADANGVAGVDGFVPDVPRSITVFFQGVERSTCRTTNVISHTFF